MLRAGSRTLNRKMLIVNCLHMGLLGSTIAAFTHLKIVLKSSCGVFWMGYFLLHVLCEIEVSGQEIARSPLKMQAKVRSATRFYRQKKT
jgi:hypothetical protein